MSFTRIPRSPDPVKQVRIVAFQPVARGRGVDIHAGDEAPLGDPRPTMPQMNASSAKGLAA